MSMLVDFSIFPIDKGESLTPYVAKAVSIIKNSNLVYELGPMGTSIEGEWDEIIGVIDVCFKALKKDSSRIYMTIKADYRKGPAERIKWKVKSVERKI